jgi:integrase
MATEALSKREAKSIEYMVKKAIRTGDFSRLNQGSREICVRYFQNRRLKIPDQLLQNDQGSPIQLEFDEEMTLERAARLCYDDPDVQGKSETYRERFKQCVAHLLEYMGPHCPVESIRVRDIKHYCKEREKEGAASATITRERYILSKIYRYLMENDLITKNPAILVRNSAETSTTKAIYIPKAGFEKIVDALPSWYKPIAWTAFYTGMRQGEIRNLNRSQLNLDRRIIELSSADTKEGRSKKIPIHKDLVPILRDVLTNGRIIGIDTVFLRDGQPIARTQMRRYWEKACREAGYPGFRFHGIRHIWKTNARASGINGEIRRAIMGHSERRGSVHERYGPKVMKEYLEAVDMMEFDHSGDKASSG